MKKTFINSGHMCYSQDIQFISYIYILYYQSSINSQFSPNLAGFPDILNLIRHNVGFGIAKTPNFRA